MSRFGLALRSLREDEQASAAFGRDIYRLNPLGRSPTRPKARPSAIGQTDRKCFDASEAVRLLYNRVHQHFEFREPESSS